MSISHSSPSTRVCASAIVLLVLATLIGCASDRSVIDNAAQMHGSLKPAVMNDQRLNAYLTELGDRIIDAAADAHEARVGSKAHFKEDTDWMFSERMQFHLVNSKTLNAFTTGGEHMYLYNELFQSMKNEDELAAVMAHEFAHVYGRHVAKGMDRRWWVLGAAGLVGAGGYALGGKDKGAEYAMAGAGLGLAGASFLNMGFTRADEDEADDLGFYFYTRAGWDPHRFHGFFQTMIDKGYDKTPEMLSDHPSLKNRVEATKRRAEELPPEASKWRRKPVADDREFKELQAHARELGKSLPDDKTLSGQQLLQALPRSCVAPVDPPDAVEARKQIVQSAEAQKKAQSK
jgi:predicted Zn-dependent protease